MKRCFSASPFKLALSATLALALTVAPVSAGNNRSQSGHDDTAAIIGALLGLAAIGAILSNNKDKDDELVRPHLPHKPVYKPTPKLRKVPMHLRLPPRCLRTYRTQTGHHKFYSTRCLKDRFGNVRHLPRSCKDTIVAKNGRGTYVTRKIFRPYCLHQNGYRAKTHY